MFLINFPAILHFGADNSVNIVLWKRNPLARLKPFVLVAAATIAVAGNHDSRAPLKVADKIHVGQIKVEMAHGHQFLLVLADRDCSHAAKIAQTACASSSVLLC